MIFERFPTPWRQSRWQYDLNVELCDFFGVETSPRWICTNNGGKSLCAATDREHGPWYYEGDLRQWLAEQHKKGHHLDYEVMSSPIYPRVSHDEDAAIMLVKAMENGPHQILCSISRLCGDRPPDHRMRWACDLRYNGHLLNLLNLLGYHWNASHHTFAGAIARAAYRCMRDLKGIPFP